MFITKYVCGICERLIRIQNAIKTLPQEEQAKARQISELLLDLKQIEQYSKLTVFFFDFVIAYSLWLVGANKHLLVAIIAIWIYTAKISPRVSKYALKLLYAKASHKKGKELLVIYSEQPTTAAKIAAKLLEADQTLSSVL